MRPVGWLEPGHGRWAQRQRERGLGPPSGRPGGAGRSDAHAAEQLGQVRVGQAEQRGVFGEDQVASDRALALAEQRRLLAVEQRERAEHVGRFFEKEAVDLEHGGVKAGTCLPPYTLPRRARHRDNSIVACPCSTPRFQARPPCHNQ